MRHWKIRKQNDDIVRRLAEALKCTHFFARILINRGINSPQKAWDFINADETSLQDPFLFCGMREAVERIGKAIRNGEKITVYGDYDVDGITATAMLTVALRTLGGEVDFYIPNRFSDGYGVNSTAIRTIAERGTRLVITVDTGITAVKEVEEARQYGLDVIITDHHECQSILPKTLIINPKFEQSGYPFVHLAGVGVVYKLVCALDQTYGVGRNREFYSVLAAIGTIADIMPMQGENRYIVRHGLELLKKTDNPGLRALLERCVGERVIDTSTIGFVLAPRINAAGRMGSASLSVDLLTTEDADTAADLVEELCKENNQRQVIENKILEEAIAMLENDPANRNRNAIVLWSENWHNGVVGIVASRLKEKFNKPCILFSVSGDNAKGSGRSVKPFNLFEALERVSHLTEKFGGHAYASGVLVKKEHLEAFRDALCSEVDAFLETDCFDDSIEVDCVLYDNDLSVKNIKELGRLAPYGRGNETPIFCMNNVRLLEAVPTANGNHMRLSLLCGQTRITAFYFNVSPAEFMYCSGENIDIVFEADINTYNGRQNVQLSIKDVRFSRRGAKQMVSDLEQVERGVLSGRDIPSRADAVAVYRYLQKALIGGARAFDIATLPGRILSEQDYVVSAGAVYHALAILQELGILKYIAEGRFIKELEIHAEKKVNLEDSKLLKEIKEKAGEMACV